MTVVAGQEQHTNVWAEVLVVPVSVLAKAEQQHGWCEVAAAGRDDCVVAEWGVEKLWRPSFCGFFVAKEAAPWTEDAGFESTAGE